MRSSLIRQLTGLVNRPDVVSFAAGSPNPEIFPADALTTIAERLTAELGGRFYQYSVTRGDAGLIEAVRERLERVQGITASQQETLLVSGSQQGLDFVARILLDPGDAVFVELPNYIGATSAFENFRAKAYGVRKTAEGMDLEHLRSQIAKARQDGAAPKLIYVIPNFQNPSGHTWTLERRRELLELARAEDVLIFEDDAYGELYHPDVDPAELRPIRSFDEEGRVLYLATYSKTVAPGLRVAALTGHADLIRRVELAKETGDLCSSTIGQKILLEFMRSGEMDAHVPRVRKFYAEKAGRMQEGLEKNFEGLATWNRPKGGLFLWVELADPVDALELLHASLETEKVAFIPGAPFFVDGSGSSTLRLSFSNVTDHNIERGLDRLSALIRSRRSAPSGA